MEVDINRIIQLAESAERRAGEIHADYELAKKYVDIAHESVTKEELSIHAASLLNDFFYWSGKATSYRGIIAMAEMQTIVEDELEEEGSCP